MGLLLSLMSISPAKPVLAQDDFTVTVGQDKVFTELNYANSWTQIPCYYGDYWCSGSPPSTAEAIAAGNHARTSVLATIGWAPEAQADIGTIFNWNIGQHTWEEVKNWPVSVTVSFSYSVEAFWWEARGYAASGIVVKIGEKEIGIYKPGPGGPGSDSGTTSLTYASTIQELEQLERKVMFHLYSGAVSCLSQTVEPRASAEVNVSSIKIEFTNGNPPVANNDAYSTNEDIALTVPAPGVLGNDNDVDGDTLTAILVSGPSRGTLTLNADGSFAYTPDVNYNGTDSFTYKANDGKADSNIAAVTITVTEENQPPVASFTYSPEKPMIGQEITFDASSSYDPDGAPITYKWDFDASDGISIDSTELNPKHSYLASGTYVVTLIVNDGKVDSLPATAEITIRGKEFMITFDDGPLLGKTDNILLQLMNFKVDGERVKAGFFMVGNSSLPYYAPFDFEWDKGSVTEYPDVANKVAGLGHLIGNHTQHHTWFPQWGAFGFNSMEDFVKNEISQCDIEIENAINKTPLKIFRPPYLQHAQYPIIYEYVKELGFEIVGGSIGDAPYGFGGVEGSKKKAKAILEKWEKDEPVVLIFHDNRPTTYDHIGEIISYLEDEGFALVHFDPNRIGVEQKTTQALSGAAFSPVDLNIIDPDGFILNKHVNQIQGSLYEEIDINEDGNLEDFFVVPEPKIGNYQIQVIPEVGASTGDVYSLDVEDGQKLITLANNTPISEIPEQPYLVQITDGGIQIIPATVRIEPETLNLASKGEFTAFITLPEGYDVANIDVSTVVCEGAPAVKGMVSEEDKGTYIAKFNRQDLVNMPTGDVVTLRVTGKVYFSGILIDFEGSDTIRVIDKGKGKK